MARYTLRTYCGGKQLERFDHRSAEKLRGILNHPRHHRAGHIDRFGDLEKHADKFEIMDSTMEKLFEGSIDDAVRFAGALR